MLTTIFTIAYYFLPIILLLLVIAIVNNYKYKEICEEIDIVNKDLIKKKSKLIIKVFNIDHLKKFRKQNDVIPNIRIYNDEKNAILLKSQFNYAILEEMAYDISEILELNVVPTTVVCNVNDLLFNCKIIGPIDNLIIGYSKNIVIQELGERINTMSMSNDDEFIELPPYKKSLEFDLVAIQKVLMFDIIIGKRSLERMDIILRKNGIIYEVNNYYIGNKSTDSWILSSEQFEDIKINQEIKRNLILLREKLIVFLKKYKISNELKAIKNNIMNNYNRLINRLVSMEVVKIRDLQDFHYSVELCTDRSKLE